MNISIVIPVYNVEKYLRRCLDSVVNQTYKYIEIIIVNDQTKDNSHEVIRSYLHDQRIKYIINDENSGLSTSRNNGLKHATGDYIMFVDSDDTLELNAVETLVHELKQHEYDYIIFNATTVNEEDEIIDQPCINYTSLLTDKENYVIGPQYAWSKIYKRELFNEIQFPDGLNYEDLATMPKILFNRDNFKLLYVSLYNYRMREGSITKTHNNRSFEFYKVLDTLYEFDMSNYGKLSNEMQIQIYSNICHKFASLRHIKGLKNRLKHLKIVKSLMKKYCPHIRRNQYYKPYVKYQTNRLHRMSMYAYRFPLGKLLYVLLVPGERDK